MWSFNRIITLTIVIGVLQVCNGNPTDVKKNEEETVDVTKLFTADELQRARSAGILDYHLVNGRRRGVSVDETIKLHQLAKSEEPLIEEDLDGNDTTRPTTFAEMTKICDIFDTEHKTTTNYTKDQETHLNALLNANDDFPRDIQFPFLRTSVCDYVSNPSLQDANANSFGLQLVRYMKFRFWKSRNENATGVERVKVAKELCCIYEGRAKVAELNVRPILSDKQMTYFSRYCKEYEASDTSKSFEKMCDFLRTTNPSEEC